MLNLIHDAFANISNLKILAVSTILILANLLFNILANVGFKLSIQGPGWREFIIWQLIGNLAGLVTVITLTLLLKFIPLHVAFPVTTGLAVIGISLVAARMVFHEEITSYHWLGTIFVVIGIALLSQR